MLFLTNQGLLYVEKHSKKETQNAHLICTMLFQEVLSFSANKNYIRPKLQASNFSPRTSDESKWIIFEPAICLDETGQSGFILVRNEDHGFPKFFEQNILQDNFFQPCK